MPETCTKSPGLNAGLPSSSTNVPPVESWMKKRPFQVGSEAVTTPVIATGRPAPARPAGSARMSAQLVRPSSARNSGGEKNAAMICAASRQAAIQAKRRANFAFMKVWARLEHIPPEIFFQANPSKEGWFTAKYVMYGVYE